MIIISFSAFVRSIYTVMDKSRLLLVMKLERAKFDTSKDREEHLAAWDYKLPMAEENRGTSLSIPYAVAVDHRNSSLCCISEFNEADADCMMEKVTALMQKCLPNKVFHMRDNFSSKQLELDCTDTDDVEEGMEMENEDCMDSDVEDVDYSMDVGEGGGSSDEEDEEEDE